MLHFIIRHISLNTCWSCCMLVLLIWNIFACLCAPASGKCLYKVPVSCCGTRCPLMSQSLIVLRRSLVYVVQHPETLHLRVLQAWSWTAPSHSWTRCSQQVVDQLLQNVLFTEWDFEGFLWMRTDKNSTVSKIFNNFSVVLFMSASCSGNDEG